MKRILTLILSVLIILSAFSFETFAASKPDKLTNSLYKLQSGKFTVGYFGGSVTCGVGATDQENTSWRGITFKWFKDNFSKADIKQVDASIGATGSNFGLYRVDKHLNKSKAPDLCFIEFAVNDKWPNCDGNEIHDRYNNIEAIIRKIYASNPKSDIVFVITGDFDSLALDATSDIPMFGDQYTELANYYNLPILYVGRELVRMIYAENGNKYPENKYDTAWSKYFKDIVHPVDLGYAHYAKTITDFLSAQLKTGYKASSDDYVNKYNPEITYSETINRENLYLNAGMFTSLSELENCTNSGFEEKDGFIQTNKNGSVIAFDFESPNIGLWFAYGAENEISYSIDNGEVKTATLLQADGTNRMVILGTDLGDSKHRLEIKRISGNGTLYIKGFVYTGKAYVGKLTEYNKLPQVSKPTFKLEGTGKTKKMNVSCATDGAEIYYTLDGSDPVSSSTRQKYTGAISLKKDTDIKAYAKKSNMRDSEVATFEYKTYMEGKVITANESYVIGGEAGVSFHTNCDLNKLVAVKINGQLLENEKYSTDKQNKLIILKPIALDGFKVGTYTLTAVFLDGETECKFKVVEKEAEENTEEKETAAKEKAEKEKKKKDNTTLLIVIILVSSVILGVGAGIALFFIVKKRNEALITKGEGTEIEGIGETEESDKEPQETETKENQLPQ